MVHTATEALLIKRTDHDDFWQSVTGTLHWNETPDQAATRELFEETAINVSSLRQTGVVRTYSILEQWQHRYPPNVKRNREHLFYCELPARCPVQLQAQEHSEYKWVTIEQGVEQVWSWSNKLALMSLCK